MHSLEFRGGSVNNDSVKGSCRIDRRLLGDKINSRDCA